MKVDENVRKELIEGLAKNLEELVAYVKETIHTISIAESVEEIMRLKQNLLLEWIGAIPMGTDACYFCIKTDFRCGDCEYGKIHKICGTDLNSDWRAILINKNTLEDSIRLRYYKGEIYSKSPKRKTIHCQYCNFKYRRVLRDNPYGLCKNCGETIYESR